MAVRSRPNRIVSIAAAICLGLATQTVADDPQPKPTLKPGQFTWHPERSPDGPVVVLVNLASQTAEVYRDGIRIGDSTVSTGRPGHVTPTGVFTILQKETMHHSNLYNAAPMPYMQRLTWGGVCLHAGGLPGYPSSHGCVHLPLAFAKLLYGITGAGTTVVIADASSAPDDVLQPSLLIPADLPGAEQTPLVPGPDQTFAWDPTRAPDGPLAILVSEADRRVYVYRNGVRIGESPITITDTSPPLVHAVYSMLSGTSANASPLIPGRPAHRWMRVDLPSPTGEVAIPDLQERVGMPNAFAAALYDALVPGTTLMVTNRSVTLETTSAPGFVVMQAEDPGATPAAQ